jgi:hypothetical protein
VLLSITYSGKTATDLGGLLYKSLYVLIPVFDDDKHHRVGDATAERLLRHGSGWLREHPERELIINRYLKHQERLPREALSRLITKGKGYIVSL